MSEFSSSYHVRTDDAERTLGTLVRRNWAGICFGPGPTGWHSLVPYATLPVMTKRHPYSGAAEQLCQSAGRPVLHVYYFEDSGWGFSYFECGRLLCRLIASWNGGNDERPVFDPSVLARYASADLIVSLAAPWRPGDASEPPSYRLGAALGLPRVACLSPDYAWSDPDDLVAEGGRTFGE